jgi:hypothetical protein
MRQTSACGQLRTFKMISLNLSLFLSATFAAHVTNTIEPGTAETPPDHSDDVFDNQVTPWFHRSAALGCIVAVASRDLHETSNRTAMLPIPPAHFDSKNAVFERSFNTSTSLPSECHAASARKSPKHVALVNTVPEFFKKALTWFTALKIGKAAASSNLETQAAAAALVSLFVLCVLFPSIFIAENASSHSTKNFVPYHVFGSIFILVTAAVQHVMHVLPRCSASKPGHPKPFGRTRRSVVVPVITAFLCCASCLHAAAAAEVADSVRVDPFNGQDAPFCDPCRTINYAIHVRRATSVLLTEGTFTEVTNASIYINSSAGFVTISGSGDNTVIDCGRSGPAFIIANTSVAIAGVVFQNCVNFNASGTGAEA